MAILDKIILRRDRKIPSIPAYRIGDAALFLVWMPPSITAAVNAFKRARSRDYPAAAYRTMSAVVFVVQGALFLRRGPAVNHREGLAPKLVAVIGTWAIIPLANLRLTRRPRWLLLLSTFGLLATEAVVLWSMVTLGHSFSIFPEGRQLIRSGPYRLVRHPLYTTYFAIYVLTALPRLSPAALVYTTVGIGADVLRARHEEHVLQATFPDYAAYAAITPRFWPRIAGGRIAGQLTSARAS